MYPEPVSLKLQHAGQVSWKRREGCRRLISCHLHSTLQWLICHQICRSRSSIPSYWLNWRIPNTMISKGADFSRIALTHFTVFTGTAYHLHTLPTPFGENQEPLLSSHIKSPSTFCSGEEDQPLRKHLSLHRLLITSLCLFVIYVYHHLIILRQ